MGKLGKKQQQKNTSRLFAADFLQDVMGAISGFMSSGGLQIKLLKRRNLDNRKYIRICYNLRVFTRISSA